MNENAPIVVVEVFDQTPARVWEAITQLDQMHQWYFDNIPAFKAEVGFSTEFTVACGGREFPHLWTVTEVVPQSRLVYDWRFGGYPGDSFVSFELFEEEGGTRLRLTHQVREPFPQDIPEFKRESCLGGWTYFINERLKAYLVE